MTVNEHENYITLHVDPIKVKVSVFLLLFYISQATSTKLNVKSKYGYGVHPVSVKQHEYY
jgi:hypothetical protein